MNSVNEVGHILNSMVAKTMILLQQGYSEQKLREFWTETVIICNEWNIDTMQILRDMI